MPGLGLPQASEVRSSFLLVGQRLLRHPSPRLNWRQSWASRPGLQLQSRALALPRIVLRRGLPDGGLSVKHQPATGSPSQAPALSFPRTHFPVPALSRVSDSFAEPDPAAASSSNISGLERKEDSVVPSQPRLPQPLSPLFHPPPRKLRFPRFSRTCQGFASCRAASLSSLHTRHFPQLAPSLQAELQRPEEEGEP